MKDFFGMIVGPLTGTVVPNPAVATLVAGPVTAGGAIYVAPPIGGNYGCSTIVCCSECCIRYYKVQVIESGYPRGYAHCVEF